MLCERPSGKTVPPGINENVLFVLDNEENATWQASGQRACYADDCGTWSGKASSKTHHYIMSEENDLAYVDKKDGQFVKFTKGERVVVDPQPVNNVIVFKRYYISLKRDPSFKRRISVVAECPDELSHVKRVAVVEYIGNYPQNNAPHGNSKNIIGDYVRTACAVKRKIEDMVEARKTPRAIYEDMVLDSSNYAPRDLKQVQNAKYAAGKKKRTHDKGNNHMQNAADEIQTLLSDIHEHPFIQEIVQTKGKPPAVILYLEENLKDIKQFCTSNARNPSVLGVDRTFNLGACFATTLVYQHNNLKRKGTGNPPIMLAAIYLHWDGLYTTYHRFFSHIQSKLELAGVGGTQFSKIVFGSDEEAALTKAVKQCFPSSVQVLCTRHLEENVRRYLANNAGVKEKVRRQVLTDIFGSNGLTSSNEVNTFKLKVVKLSDKYHKHIPAFKEYFEKIAEKICTGVFLPRVNNRWIPIDWKNNACESMNHIIKLSANWKVMKLPDLIERLYRIVKLQQVDCRRALYGHGNYELAPWMSKCKVQHVHWTQKTDEEKATLYEKFLKGLPPNKHTVSSTDGCLTIPKTAKTAKKPGQRKRVRSAKTMSKGRTK